jgi:hypothetical protein
LLFKDLTLEDIKKSTQLELSQCVSTEFTSLSKKELAETIWTIKNTPQSTQTFETLIQQADDPRGQLIRVYELSDILGTKTGSRKIEWTYYPTGEVDTIIITELDALDQIISTKTVKHFTGGRQPVLL